MKSTIKRNNFYIFDFKELFYIIFFWPSLLIYLIVILECCSMNHKKIQIFNREFLTNCKIQSQQPYSLYNWSFFNKMRFSKYETSPSKFHTRTSISIFKTILE